MYSIFQSLTFMCQELKISITDIIGKLLKLVFYLFKKLRPGGKMLQTTFSKVYEKTFKDV